MIHKYASEDIVLFYIPRGWKKAKGKFKDGFAKAKILKIMPLGIFSFPMYIAEADIWKDCRVRNKGKEFNLLENRIVMILDRE